MTKEAIFSLIAAIFYLAILYILVRPNSSGPTVVTGILDAFSDLVRGTVGYTYNSSSQSWQAP